MDFPIFIYECDADVRLRTNKQLYLQSPTSPRIIHPQPTKMLGISKLALALAGRLTGLDLTSEQSLATSDPFYPTPWMTGQGEWSDAYAKAKEFVGQLTLMEKVNLTTGVGWGMFLSFQIPLSQFKFSWVL